jgi:transcription-repair coupling factor (superfamily II helicase)
MGVRDLSIIETPPIDRLSIKTFVRKFDEKIIHDSIKNELSRGGQVYFVHNKIKSIHSIKELIQKIIPEARIGIGHGQLPEHQLENVMGKFLAKEIDVLLCTTIIESGLDIPSANTIIINRADQFGLAQLYQLRGRVGRSEKQGYSYFLIPKYTKLTYESEKRLQALEESIELGSGYKIAMRDLEIRGAGNILGKEQSGHVISIGLNLYSKLITEAKNILANNQKPLLNEFDLNYEMPKIQLNLHLEFTDDYIKEHKVKFELYKQLNLMND